MTIEKRLTREASKIRPMAKVHFERMGQILTIFWDWEYRGLKLHYSRMELLEDYESDPDMVGSVIDFCVIQMSMMEKKIDEATGQPEGCRPSVH